MEALLVLDPAAQGLRDQIERRLQIVQEVSTSVLVVRGDPADVLDFAKLPGVTAEDELRISDKAGATLAPSERLFVEAWLEHHDKMEEKTRRDDQLNWGSEGYKAP
jgi:hypothetical protein